MQNFQSLIVSAVKICKQCLQTALVSPHWVFVPGPHWGFSFPDHVGYSFQMKIPVAASEQNYKKTQQRFINVGHAVFRYR